MRRPRSPRRRAAPIAIAGIPSAWILRWLRLFRRPSCRAADCATGAALTWIGRRGPQQLAVARHGHVALHDVVEVEDELAVLARREQLHEVDEVRAVELRGLGRQPGREVGVADDPAPRCRVTTISSATEPSTLPPLAAAMSTMTEPGLIEATISPVMSRGAGRPGMSAVVTMMSTSGAWAAYSSAAAPVVLLAHLLGVAVARRRGRVHLGHLHGEEVGAHRLDLLGHLGRGHRSRGRWHRASGPCRSRRALPRRPLRRAPWRGHLAGGRDLAGEERAELVGGLDDGAVAGDVGHRATGRRATVRG